MSPLSLRRYRADRLLRAEFEAMREGVLAVVRGRLRASGAELDPADLEACYAEAWQGLYGELLDGRQIDSPGAWLAVVTFRRAIDEHRGAVRARSARTAAADAQAAGAGVAADDPSARLDDRALLRQLFEGLCARLSGREREAAVLCYLQGLTRSQAAARMGLSETRMRKLMEGSRAGRPGVAGKMAALVQTIRDGGWCDEQASLMRALAYGVLDPGGERYRVALSHSGECPACRAYVASLRGLAVALPPLVLPGGLGAGALVFALGATRESAGAASRSACAGAAAGRSASGALPASTAGAGAGAGAGGSWVFAGGLGAKLVAGCVLAIGVGAGCVALDPGARRHLTHRAPAHTARRVPADARVLARGFSSAAVIPARQTSVVPASRVPARALAPAARAGREFGPERIGTAGASAARAGGGAIAVAPAGTAAPAIARAAGAATSAGPPAQGARGAAAAEREFRPG